MDLIGLFLYSQEDFGSVDLPLTLILFQVIEFMKDDDLKLRKFIAAIAKAQKEQF